MCQFTVGKTSDDCDGNFKQNCLCFGQAKLYWLHYNPYALWSKIKSTSGKRQSKQGNKNIDTAMHNFYDIKFEGHFPKSVFLKESAGVI